MEVGPTPNLATTPPSSISWSLRRSSWTTRVPRTHWPRSLSGVQMMTCSTAAVVAGHRRRTGEGVVGLELDHGPHHDPERDQGLLERPGLRPQIRVDAVPGLVARPQVVAERLDHMVGGDAHVRRALAQELQHGADHPPDGGNLLAGRIAVRRRPEEVAEQLVGPVDEVHLHDGPESVIDPAAAAATGTERERSARPRCRSAPRAASYAAAASERRPSRRSRSARTAWNR